MIEATAVPLRKIRSGKNAQKSKYSDVELAAIPVRQGTD